MTVTGIDASLHRPACTHHHAAAPPRSRLHTVATRSRAGTLLAFLAGVTVWVMARNPLRSVVFPPCPLHATTGIWCPGCGATRASYLMLNGDLVGAMHFNAMWVVLSPFVVYQVAAFAGEAWGVRWLRRIPMTQPVIAGLLVAIFGFAIVRNLPFELFEVLNPVTAS